MSSSYSRRSLYRQICSKRSIWTQFEPSHVSACAIRRSRLQRWSSNNALLLDRTECLSAAQGVLGPRAIFDAARENDKVITTSYEQLVDLLSSNLHVDDFSPADLFIVSKILRRQPQSHTQEVQARRLRFARSLSAQAASRGFDEAILFNAEETLRDKKTANEDAQRAITSLLELATKGYGKANFLLAEHLHAKGDLSRAAKAYQLAAEQGLTKAWSRLGKALSAQGYKIEAQRAYKRGAAADDAQSQFLLSLETQDTPRRVKLLQQATSNGSIEAAHNLGEHYRKVGQHPLAKDYYEIAADRDFQPSQINLAMLLSQANDHEAARIWLERAEKIGGELGEHAGRARRALDTHSGSKKSPGSCCLM